jgi:hypothetical protein
MLKLTYKDFNGTVDITNYIKELNDDVKKFYFNKDNEEINENDIKSLFLRKKYFVKKDSINSVNNINNIITWRKNKKSFYLFCEEIRIEHELMGYYFHFEKHSSYNNTSSSSEKFDTIYSEQNNNNKKFIQKRNKVNSSSIQIPIQISNSNSFGNKFQNGDFVVDSNIIHKATSTRTEGEKDPVITTMPSKIIETIMKGIAIAISILPIFDII